MQPWTVELLFGVTCLLIASLVVLLRDSLDDVGALPARSVRFGARARSSFR